MSLQAMDTSHVSLVQVTLNSQGFEHYRCDRPMTLGFDTGMIAKILKCAGNDDAITMKAGGNDADKITFMFESSNGDRVSDFELKLMDIDQEQLGIPDTEYKCTIQMPSGEFQRIVRDLQVLGDSCQISVTKEGCRFSVSGENGSGNILIKQSASSDKDEEHVIINMEEPVDLTFSQRYLNFFTKATSLGPTVILSLSPEVPIVVEYPIEGLGSVKYYLAPKIDDDDAA